MTENRNGELESVIDQLVRMRGSPRLNAVESRVAGMLLTRLKEEFGLSDKKIEEMTGGAWKVPTIKHHTRGVRTRTSLVPNEVDSTFAKMREATLSLHDVKNATEMKRIFDQQGVSLTDVAQFVSHIRNAGMSLESFVAHCKEIMNSKIPIAELAQSHSFRKILEALNIDNKKLEQLVEAVKKLGDFDDTLKALILMGSLAAINSAIQTQSSKKVSLDKEVNTLEIKKQSIQVNLDLYEELETMGFTQDILGQIKESAAKFGEPQKVISGLNHFGSLKELEKVTQETNRKAELAASNIRAKQDEYSGWSRITSMCDQLLQRGFSEQDIESITNLAKQHGKPQEVFKQVGKYGLIPELEEKIRKVTQEKDEERGKREIAEEKVVEYKTGMEKVTKERDQANYDLIGVKGQAREILKRIFEELDKPSERRQFDKEILYSDLPDSIEKVVEEQVVKRLQIADHNKLIAPFMKEVKGLVELNLIKWQKGMGVKTPQRVEKLKLKLHEDPFIGLRGNWYFECEKCNYPHTLKLMATSDIAGFLRKGYADVPSLYGFTYGNHSITARFFNLVRLYIKKLD